MKYRPEIDGLRAVAVVPVILFHAGFTAFSGGYVGVDVFFVISGYLITGLLIEEMNAGTFSLAGFYQRRARRILPALFFVMFACIPFAWFWMLPQQFEDFTESLVAVSLFSSNLLFWWESGYFTLASEEKPLLHTWSLAIEEQFYVLFPLFLLMIWRLGVRKAFGFIAAVALLSLLLSEWASIRSAAANFFLAPTRIWELLAGSLCALIHFRLGRFASNMLSLTGLAMIGFAVFAFDAYTRFPSVYTLVPVVGTALILLYGPRGTWVASLLSTRVLVGIGLISYSTYLWHQPLFAFARIRSTLPPGDFLLAFLALLSLVLGYLSWRWIEKPFRQPGGRFFLSARGIMASVLAGLIAVFALDAFSQHTNGRESLWLASRPPEMHRMYRMMQDARTVNYDLPHESGECRFDVDALNSAIEQRILACARKHGSGIAIIGDSHAQDLFGAISHASRQEFIFSATMPSCRPYTRVQPCHYGEFRAFVAANPSIFDLIIYHQAGPSLLLDRNGMQGSLRLFKRYGFDRALPSYRVSTRHIAEVAFYLRDLSRHARVAWLGPRIEPHVPRNFMLRSGCTITYRLRENQSATFYRLDEAIGAELQRSGRSPSLRFVSASELLQLDMRRDFMTCDQLFWVDGDHWTTHGERRFGERLRPLLALAPRKTPHRKIPARRHSDLLADE